MKKLISLILSAGLSISAFAQYHSDEFPNYKDYSIPKPDDFVKITKADLNLTDKYLSQYPNGTPTADQATLYKLYDFFKNDPDGRTTWNILQTKSTKIVSAWDLKLAGGFNRYIYSISGLKDISMTYMFTGNKMLSKFVIGHLKKITALPMDFWIHSELRGLDPKKPKGTLETAQLNETIGFAIAACGKDMTPEELKALEDAWRERGLQTASNWLDKPWKNNFTAVISTGLLYAAKYFNDAEAKAKAFKCLKYYIDNCIEPDGSYAEGYGYFSYPMGCLIRASLIMSKDEIEDAFGKSSLKDCMKWRIYGHIFDIEGDKPGVMRISWGDNPYGDSGCRREDPVSYFSSIVYKDPLSLWFREKYSSRDNVNKLILESKFNSSFPVEPTSPKEARLPLATAFSCGDCFIRNNWDDEGIVLGLKAGDQGSRINYSHNRAELQSIQLAAFGDYLIVNSGSASYRSRLHYEYDVLTKAANTVIIDGMNQKRPGNPTYKEGKWDNRQWWVKGYPHAIVTACENYPDGGSLIRSEALDAYHLEMKEASRTVKFIPGAEFFIVVDKLTPTDGASHKFESRLHIFNRDQQTVIKGKADFVKVQRELTDLYIASKGSLKQTLVQEEGYLHAPEGRDYDADGPKQGAPGSSIGLNWQSEGKSFHNTMVIYPKRSGAKAPTIKFSGKQVIVDGVKYDIPE